LETIQLFLINERDALPNPIPQHVLHQGTCLFLAEQSLACTDYRKSVTFMFLIFVASGEQVVVDGGRRSRVYLYEFDEGIGLIQKYRR
jgi:hypothetical protein